MVDVPSARKFGFALDLHADEMRRVLNSRPVEKLVSETGDAFRGRVASHVRAVASPENAENYVASMFAEDAYSDEYGFDFDGPYSLGNRPIAVVGVPAGSGVNPKAKPPLMVEAEHHALTAPMGVSVADLGEDIR